MALRYDIDQATARVRITGGGAPFMPAVVAALEGVAVDPRFPPHVTSLAVDVRRSMKESIMNCPMYSETVLCLAGAALLLIAVLRSEIWDTYRALQRTNSVLKLRGGATNYSFSAVAMLQPIALQSAGLSGLFPATPTVNMLSAARHMKVYNELNRIVLQWRNTGDAGEDEARLRMLYDNHDSFRTVIVRFLDLVDEQLNLGSKTPPTELP